MAKDKLQKIYINVSPELAKIIEDTAKVERRPKANLVTVIVEDWANGIKPTIEPVHKIEQLQEGE